MLIRSKKLKKGFTLIEVLVVMSLIGVIAAIATPIGLNQVFRSRAQNTTISIVSQLTAIQQDAFSGRDGYSYGMSFTTNDYTVYSGTDLNSPDETDTTNLAAGITITEINFTSGDTIEFDIGSLLPNDWGTITLEGGGLTYVVTIEEQGAIYYEVNQSSRLTGTQIWQETSEAEFNDGLFTQTEVVSTGGGAVELQSDDIVNADWCTPSLTTTETDMPGNGIATDLTAVEGTVFFGTGGNASGISFANVQITDTEPPVATVLDTFDGYKTNGIYGESDPMSGNPLYGYLATDTNTREVVILNLVSDPITEIGFFNSPGSENGNDVWVNGPVGYLIRGDDLFSFDLSARTGSRPELGTLQLAGTGARIITDSNYAYVLTDDSSRELQIIDVSDPTNMSEVGYMDVPGSLDFNALHINSTSTRAYIGSDSNGGNEVYIVDISSKTGAQSIISSVDTNGMSVQDITHVEADTVIVAVGSGGEEYQVFDASTEASPTYCAGLSLSNSATGVEGVEFSASGNTYAYVINGDKGSELRIIRGGPISGGVSSQYFTSGEYVSSTYDSGSTASDFLFAVVDSDVPANTNVQIQFRAGNIPDLSGDSWIGPDGTGATYFEGNGTHTLPDSFQNQQYLEYKLTYTSDNSDTPTFKEIQVLYETS